LKPGIQKRGSGNFRVQIRRNGIYQSKTFDSMRAAEGWHCVVEGNVTAEDFVDQKTAKATTLAEACAWMIDGNHAGHRRGGTPQSTASDTIAIPFAQWQQAIANRLSGAL